MADSSAAMKSTSSNARGTKAKRRPRGSLDIEEIITGAFELAEEVSIAGLSMPVLAKHLDVPVTSIYWHFRKKEQLLDAMTERATRQYHFTNPFVDGGTWQEALRNHFRKMHLVFRENPVLCELILMRAGELSPESTHTSGRQPGDRDQDDGGRGFQPRRRAERLRSAVRTQPRHLDDRTPEREPTSWRRQARHRSDQPTTRC